MRLQLRPIFKDISLTFITQAVTLASFLFIYRLIAKNFGPEGVGEYSLIRRVLSFFLPFLLLGLGIGIPRYIAMSQDREQRSSYLKAGCLLVAAVTFVFFIFINLFNEYFAKTFFGTVDYANLVLPFSFFLAGLVLHTLVYSYFRGRLFVKTFNFLQIINLALVPLIILIFFEDTTIAKVITLMGITTFIIALMFSLFFIKEFSVHIKKRQFNHSLRQLLSYGLPRVPGHFALAGLFSLGPIFAAHFASTQEVGYLSVSQGLLYAVGAAIGPLSIILLTKVSNLVVQEKQETIRENVNFLVDAVFQCFIFVCVQLLIFADAIIKYWLGSEFFDAIPVMRIVFISIMFYAFYVTMRNILNAVTVKPLNAINLFISFGVFITIGGTLLFLVKPLSSIISLSIAFSSAMVSLGILTYASVRKIYPEKLKKDLSYLWIAILINIVLGTMAILAKSFVVSKFYYLLLFEVLIGVVYLSILWILKIEWIRKIPKIIGSMK